MAGAALLLLASLTGAAAQAALRGTAGANATATVAPPAAASGYKPADPSLLSASAAPLYTFYMYRATSDETYPPQNVNMANLPGVLWYLHHEVVIQNPRKFQITKLLRYKVQTRATTPIFKLGMNFGQRSTFDKGQCTGPFVCGREDSGFPSRPKMCGGAFDSSMQVESSEGVPFAGPFEWEKYGYFVGCNKLGNFPFPEYQVYYPEAVWYSLPGPCPSKTFDQHGPQCSAQEPGGYCKGTPTGAGDCTYNYQLLGEVTVDELVGCQGAREYDAIADKGFGCSWWNGINSTSANLQRINATRALFARKFPNQTLDEDMPSPPCDFNFGAFYREFFYKSAHSGSCHDALPGESCYENVMWAMQGGMKEHPEWFPGLTADSAFKDVQRLLYMQGKESCPLRPCDKGEVEVVAARATPAPAAGASGPTSAVAPPAGGH